MPQNQSSTLVEAPESADRRAFEAAMAGGDFATTKKPSEGDLISGVIAKITPDIVLISIGAKSEALMDVHELEGEKVGQTIEAVVIKAHPEVRLSRKLAAGRRTKAELRAAHEARIPVAGKVMARNKGGFDVAIGGAGGLRAFCPVSQIDLGRHDEAALSAFVGKTLDFRVMEYTEDGRRVVVSRAALLKVEAEANAERVRAQVVPGAVLSGTVRSLTEFGAFVNLGGLDGLVHVTEITHRRIKHPKDVLAVGQEVSVKVTKVEQDGKRISLSIRELEADPWAGIGERLAAGASFTGKVARHADFGLFVEIEPGVDGLVHVSQLPPGVTLKDETVKAGQTVQGWVRELDVPGKRLSLTLREVSTTDPWDGIESRFAEGGVASGEVENVAPFGVFVNLAPGLTGLIPNAELGLPRGATAVKAFAPGQKVEVKVIGLDRERKRISLSVVKAKEEADKVDVKKYREESAKREAAAPRSTSVFGNALLAALSTPSKSQKKS